MGNDVVEHLGVQPCACAQGHGLSCCHDVYVRQQLVHHLHSAVLMGSPRRNKGAHLVAVHRTSLFVTVRSSVLSGTTEHNYEGTPRVHPSDQS